MASPAIPGPSEKAFTRQVIQLARLHSWRVVHFAPGRAPSGRWLTVMLGDPGWPDLFLARGRDCIAVELKVKGNKATADQLAWRDALIAAGIRWCVWRETDWDAIVEFLR